MKSSQFAAVPGPEVTADQLLREGARAVPQAPAPDLGIGRPRMPPSTVSLEALHEQGRTHVLR